MADITMCTDHECNRKETCYRYIAEACKYRQSYFLNSPRRKKLGGSVCNYYWETEPKRQVKEIGSMVNEGAVYDVMFEALLNSRYITQEEAEEEVNNKIDEVVEAAEEYLDTLISTILNG